MAAGFNSILGITGVTGAGAASVPSGPFCPQGDQMDPLALYTQGEFTDEDNECPELLLYTQGEFPRPLVGAEVEVAPEFGTGSAGQGSGGRKRRYWEPEPIRREQHALEAVATALLVLDDDEDDWDDWF